MTLAIRKAIGTAPLEYRLVIEGCKYQFCTSIFMRGALADGRRRVCGLQAESLGFTESEYLAGAEIEVSINPVQIGETPEPDLDAATEVFSAIPSVVASLSLSLDVGEVTATVRDSTDLTVGAIYHVGTETISVSAIVGNDATVTRALWGTTEQTHDVTTDSAEALLVPIEDGIGVWSKRRWWLYAHGEGELATTDEGTIAMRGIIAGEPELVDGVRWSLPMGSRWDLLEQEVAATAGDRTLRGAYYPSAFPFYMRVGRSADATETGTLGAFELVLVPAGHHETNASHAAAVAAALNANATIAAWGVTFDAGERDDGTWDLYVTMPAASPRYVFVYGGSPTDGPFIGKLGFTAASDGVERYGYDITARIDTAVASTRYLCLWSRTPMEGAPTYGPMAPEDYRQIPRTINAPGTISYPRDGSDTYPVGRLYLNSVAGLTSGDEFLVPDRLGEETPPQATRVSTISTANGYIEVYRDTSITRPPRLICAGAASPTFSGAVRYGDAEGETLAGFRDELVTAAPLRANTATTPWILDDDLASWTTAVTAAAGGRGFLTRRRYSFSKGQRLEDVLKHEARLYGLFFYLDADFKIAVRPLTVDTAAVDSGRHIDGATHITDDGRGEIRQGTDGQVNVVEIQRGYDAQDDKYTQPPITVRSVGAISRAKARRVLEIRPKVAPADGEIGPDDAVALAVPSLTLFSGKIIHYTVSVPWTFFDVLVGDSVLVTDPVLPLDGARTIHDPGEGMIATRAIVVGRAWDFARADGSLTLLVTGLDTAGYAPTGRVSSASGATASWTVTLEANRYAPAGSSDSAYFSIGDKVRLVEWDSDTPTIRTGTVDSVNTSTHEIALTLDASWAGLGGAIYNLCFDAYDTPVASGQKEYAFVADATLRLDDGSETRNARSFAP